MTRCYSLEHNSDAIPANDSIHCNTIGCRKQVASFNNYIPLSRSRVLGIFNWVINVHVADKVRSHIGTTIANASCQGCGELIGWKIIEVNRQDMYVREGRFIMRLDKLGFSNYVQMIRSIQKQIKRTADTTEGYGDSNDPDFGANEQNADQDGNANKQVPNEQRVGANEKNVAQDGGSNEEYDGVISNYMMHLLSKNADQGGGSNEQNADQDRGANEQNVDQDGGANKRNADQHGGGNEQNHDQDGGPPMKRMKD